MHDCLTGIDALYNPLLLGAVNDSEDLAANTMNFAPSMWFNPLSDSGNGFGAGISENMLRLLMLVTASFHMLVK